MADDLIPADVSQFILEKIDSVAELEGLLLLSRNPDNSWSVDDLAQRLYADKDQTMDVLEHLHSLDFLKTEGDVFRTYRFDPVSPELEQTVERLSEFYAKYLVPITNLIHSKPQTKVQKFADAFKLRRKGK